jgi:hypothetical protein
LHVGHPTGEMGYDFATIIGGYDEWLNLIERVNEGES